MSTALRAMPAFPRVRRALIVGKCYQCWRKGIAGGSSCCARFPFPLWCLESWSVHSPNLLYTPLQMIKRAFEVFDTDGSGALSYEELEDVMTHMGEHMPAEQIRRLIMAADLDGSGDIDIDEFTGMILGKAF